MRAVCITLAGPYARMGGLHGDRSTGEERLDNAERAAAHFIERGLAVEFFAGFHAARLGLETTKTYETDEAGNFRAGYRIPSKVVGCWISHRALWAALQLVPDDLVLILEDDAKLPPDWRARFDRAVADAGDFDLLWVGSCWAHGKPRRHIAGEVFETKWPFCTHAYVVRKRALATLIATQDEVGCYAPIDMSLTFHTMSKLKVFTVLPRIIDQFDTEIPL